jgi:hypothetical protein
MANGQIILMSGGSANPAGWVSFDGIEFDVEDVRQVASSAAQPMDAVHMVGAAGEPAFANGWLNYDSGGLRNVRFRKDPFGKVRLAGLAKTGPSGSRIFTLPVGYRPLSAQPFLTIMSPGQAGAELDVAPDGAVTPYGGAVSTYVSLDGVEFDTESQSSYPSAFVQINAPPRVTSLPIGPSDGQECYFVADAANGVLWYLRYNAASASPYKWEVIGGSPLVSFNGVSEAIPNTGNAAQDFTNPALVVLPLAGDYELESVVTISPASNAQVNVQPYTGAQGTGGTAIGANVSFIGTGPYGVPVTGGPMRALAVPAGTVRLRGSTNGASVTYITKSLRAMPVRVG